MTSRVFAAGAAVMGSAAAYVLVVGPRQFGRVPPMKKPAPLLLVMT